MESNMIFMLVLTSVLICLISCEVVPSPSHLRYQSLEVGAFSHFGMQTFVGDMCSKLYTNNNLKFSLPHPDTYNPELLDTDQWAQSAKNFGAKYLVLVAQHCGGFSQWPTKAEVDGIQYNYSVRFSKWRDGKGDLVADFIESCKKYDLLPGIYYPLNINYYLNAFQGFVQKTSKDPLQLKVTQEQYESIVIQHLTELWSNYGDLAEIWFDGGYSSSMKQRVIDTINKYANKTVAFQGPTEYNGIRWVGNELGEAIYPSWSRTNSILTPGGGNPDGSVWAPPECDTIIRNRGWFWEPDHDKVGIKTLSTLVRNYHRSAGRNCNLLLNMNPDTRGLVPETDVARYKELGDYVQKCYGTPIASTHGSGNELTLDLEGGRSFNRIILMEELSKGQFIRKFTIEGLVDGAYTTLFEGTAIGHKLIVLLEKPITTTKIRLFISEASSSDIVINDLSIYSCEDI